MFSAMQKDMKKSRSMGRISQVSPSPDGRRHKHAKLTVVGNIGANSMMRSKTSAKNS